MSAWILVIALSWQDFGITLTQAGTYPTAESCEVAGRKASKDLKKMWRVDIVFTCLPGAMSNSR